MASAAGQQDTRLSSTPEMNAVIKDVESGPVPELPRPRSLVATTSDHSKRDAVLSKCCSNLYDILTILISVADIVTDIMVLISYYFADRMTFFWISFIILIIAQIGYIILFFTTFKFDKKWFRVIEAIDVNCPLCLDVAYYVIVLPILCITFFCLLLPFGHLVAFAMYFAENDDSVFSKWLRNTVGIRKKEQISLREHMSERTRMAAEKLNKHGGFILEAFLEALPQSILQLIAMVYFEKTS